MRVWNTGASVRYGDRDAVRSLLIELNFDVLAEFESVVDQVDHDAPQGLRVGENRHSRRPRKVQRLSGIGVVTDEAVDQGVQIGLAALLTELIASACQGKPLLDERLHFLKVALQLCLGVTVAQEVSAQPHARDWILKSARYPRQNLNPLRSLLGNAPLHGVKCRGGTGHFVRTILREQLAAQFRSKAIGRALEAGQRPCREFHCNPCQDCERHELNGERGRQPRRNHRSLCDELEQYRTAVPETNEPAQLASMERIQVEHGYRVVSGPQHVLQTRQIFLSPFGWRRFDFSSVSGNVPIRGSSEPIEPGGSFFGPDPVEDG